MKGRTGRRATLGPVSRSSAGVNCIIEQGGNDKGPKEKKNGRERAWERTKQGCRESERGAKEVKKKEKKRKERKQGRP